MACSDKARVFFINIKGVLKKCGEHQTIMAIIKNIDCKRLQLCLFYLH